MTTPVDQQTVHMVKTIQDAALRNGWDFAEALAQSGLLLTPLKRRQMSALVLDELLYQLEQQQPTTFMNLGGGQPTVTDGANGVLEFIRMYRKMFE